MPDGMKATSTVAAVNPVLDRLRVRIFADGADRAGMLALYADPLDQRNE